jgi:hypothetical protein
MPDPERPGYFQGYRDTQLDSSICTVGASVHAGIDSNA